MNFDIWGKTDSEKCTYHISMKDPFVDTDCRSDLLMDVIEDVINSAAEYFELMNEDINEDRNEEGFLNTYSRNNLIKKFNAEHLDNMLDKIKVHILEMQWIDDEEGE